MSVDSYDGPPDERKPLWEVMRAADASCVSDFTSPEARVIRAVRDWLVPEEEEPNPAGYPAWTRQRERIRLRALLTAEADRAERGDD